MSSARPRTSVIGTWVCAFTKPGRMTRPSQSMRSRASQCSSLSPTATMLSPVTATDPRGNTSRDSFIVRMVAFVRRRSHEDVPAGADMAKRNDSVRTLQLAAASNAESSFLQASFRYPLNPTADERTAGERLYMPHLTASDVSTV